MIRILRKASLCQRCLTCTQFLILLIGILGGGVQLGPLGTAATNRPIVPATGIMMMEKLVEWWLAEETEVLGENLPQRHLVHQKPHMPARTRTRAAAVGSQRLTTRATARPNLQTMIRIQSSCLVPNCALQRGKEVVQIHNLGCFSVQICFSYIIIFLCQFECYCLATVRWNGTYILWACRRALHSSNLDRRKNSLTTCLVGLEARNTAAISDVTKSVLQRVWQEVYCRWNVCRATNGTHCEVFRIWQSFRCVWKAVAVVEWNTAKNTLISVFIHKLQVPEIPALILVESVFCHCPALARCGTEILQLCMVGSYGY
jgi:hypothetical protein